MTTKKRLVCALITAAAMTLMVSPAMAVDNCDQVCGPGVPSSTACAVPWSGKVINCYIWDLFFSISFPLTASGPTLSGMSDTAMCGVDAEWFAEPDFMAAE